MVAKKKETAEQKLLKMIEASSSGGASSTGISGSAIKTKTVKKKNLLEIIRISNKFLIFLAIVVLILVGYEFQAGQRLMGKSIDVNNNYGAPVKAANEANLLGTVQKLSYYLANLDRRNLFKPYEEEVAQTTKTTNESADSSRKIRKLKLVGVSWLDSPETATVMIEDTEKKLTYFLQAGEKMGDISVKSIYADSVDLAYENEEILLKYEKPQK